MSKTKRYYWLKLNNDNFFNTKEVKKLRRIAGGDTYAIIYQRLILLSTEANGYICYEGVEDTFEEEIAYQLGEKLEDVKMTLSFLYKHDLIVEVDGNISIKRYDEYVGSETDKATLMRKKRAVDKQIKLEEIPLISNFKEVEGNNVTNKSNNVTECYPMLQNVTIYKSKNKKKNKTQSKIYNKTKSKTESKTIDVDIYKYIQEILSFSFRLNDSQKGQINKWVENYTHEDIIKACKFAKEQTDSPNLNYVEAILENGVFPKKARNTKFVAGRTAEDFSEIERLIQKSNQINMPICSPGKI